MMTSNRNAKALLAGLMLSAAPVISFAAPSINDMQGCQAMVGFVHSKLDAAAGIYGGDDVAEIKTGLSVYDNYIQEQVITPGLLAFNGNDKTKAREMQKQVDAYKSNLINQLNARYTQPTLQTDYAFALEACAKKSMPTGDVLKSLTQALQLMVKLAVGRAGE